MVRPMDQGEDGDGLGQVGGPAQTPSRDTLCPAGPVPGPEHMHQPTVTWCPSGRKCVAVTYPPLLTVDGRLARLSALGAWSFPLDTKPTKAPAIQLSTGPNGARQHVRLFTMDAAHG